MSEGVSDGKLQRKDDGKGEGKGEDKSGGGVCRHTYVRSKLGTYVNAENNTTQTQTSFTN